MPNFYDASGRYLLYQFNRIKFTTIQIIKIYILEV